MKKLFLLNIIMLVLLITSCAVNYNEYPSSTKKPSTNYYTNLMASELNENLSFQAMLLEMNFSKEISLNEDEKYTIINFLCSLEKDSFITPSGPIEKSPRFKLYLDTEEGSYVINIYDEELISLYPWDGVFKEDFISMKNTPKAYNLHGLCNYILNKQ